MDTSAKEPTRQRGILTALLVAVVYPAVGIAFAMLDRLPSFASIRVWRLAAWFVSAVAFGAHLAYERLRLRSSTLRAALHASFAVALGAFFLAIWVNIHGRVAGSQQSPLAPLALVLFPLITGIPAFLVAVAGMTVLSHMRQHRP